MKGKIVILLILFAILFGGYLIIRHFSKGETQKIEFSQDNGENINAENSISENSPVETEKAAPENSAPEKESASQEIPSKKADTSFEIINRLVSWGYEKAAGRKIDTIIIHSTYNATGGDEFSVDKIIGIYKSYSVSPHYLIARDGKIYRLVSDGDIAYHAGESKTPDGRTNVNNFSIGIEIINSKTEGPTEAQYTSLKQLVASLKSKYSIKYVLGHSDIAPGRKDDPWKFDLKRVK